MNWPSEWANREFKDKRYFFKGSECFIQPVDGSDPKLKKISELIKNPPNSNPIMIIAGPLGTAIIPQPLTPKPEVPTSGFDAAFNLAGDVLCFVDEKGNYSFYTEDEEDEDGKLVPVQEWSEISNIFWDVTIFANKTGNFAPANAVFNKDGQYFILRDGQYEVYSSVGTNLIPMDGFPKPIKGNLNFNMDKLFNKLHVVFNESNERLNITYTTPRNEVLLSGELGADFTFDPIQPSPDNTPIIYKIRLWEAFLRENIRDFVDTSEDYKIQNKLTSIIKDVDDLKQKTEQVKRIKMAAELFKEAAKYAQKLAGKNPKPADKERLDTAITQFENILETTPSVMVAHVKDIHSKALELKAALDEFEKAKKDEDKNALNKTLINQCEQSTTIANNILGKPIEKEISSIKGQSKSLKTEIDEVRDNTVSSDYDLSESIERHRYIASTFEIFLNKTQQQITELLAVHNPENSKAPDIESGRALLPEYKIATNESVVAARTASEKLSDAGKKKTLENIQTELEEANLSFKRALKNHLQLNVNKESIELKRRSILTGTAAVVNSVKEILLGRADLFPSDFKITNTSNFTFSEPDWYCFEAEKGTFLCRPLTLDKNGKYEIIRLTTSVIPQLSSRLFSGGIKSFLSLDTQRLYEEPGFGDGKIAYNTSRFSNNLPTFENLDFRGANADYYWEMFFHAPFLIAQSLNANQKFEEAKQWYEYIFDPTDAQNYWQFLPFHTKDIPHSGAEIKRYLSDPFDPHAIAALRQTAYRKAIVMAYIDNLLDWGDMLFRQYTHESINEARLLYIQAYDLLGPRPENLGSRILSEDRSYAGLAADSKGNNQPISNAPP